LDVLDGGIADMRRALEAGEVRARELAEGYLTRVDGIDRSGPSLNAVIELNPDALELADASDRRLAEGRARGPLEGIPVLLKDNIDTGDRMSTTAGSLALAGHRAAADAGLVQRLRAAGFQLRGARVLERFFQAIRAAVDLGPGQREEPVNVRVLEIQCELAGPANVARTAFGGRLAQEQLREPQCHPLAPDARGPVQQHGRRHFAAGRRRGEALAYAFVALDGRQRAHPPGLGFSHCSGSTGTGAPPRTGAWMRNSRCGPSGVFCPPTVPTTWPALTSWPSTTSIFRRCM